MGAMAPCNVFITLTKEQMSYFDCVNDTSCLCSTSASAVCFVGWVADLDAAETVNELSQPKFELKGLTLNEGKH